jgi:acetyltransferase-like isoleucine patch superfamily enzyme
LYYFLFRERGKNIVIDSPILLTANCISIGNRVHIYKNSRIEGISKYLSATFKPSIIIEDNVGIEQNIHLTCAESVIIKKNTSIANNVTITDIHHSYDNIDIPIEQQPIVTDPVSIGPNSKIYAGVVILPGVHLGKHTVIAANSVVRKGIYPDFCIIAGCPGVIVKRYSHTQDKWMKTNSKGDFIS